jgi:hypothetical protein
MGWLTVIIIFLVTFRVTRFIIKDSFPPFAVPRDYILNWWEPDDDWLVDKNPLGEYKHPDARPHWGRFGRTLRYLFTCPWCMSIWIGAGTVASFDYYVSVPLPWAIWLAASAVTGLIMQTIDSD